MPFQQPELKPLEYTRALVLEHVRHSSGLTRAGIGRLTRLSPQTVSNVTRGLIEDGLIRETGTLSPEGRGRPGTTLELCPTRHFTIGVHIDPAALCIVAVDLAGETIAESLEPLPSAEDPATVTREVADRIDATIASTGLPRDRLLGVGVAAPGPIDKEQGQASPPLLPGWHRIPIGPALAERLTAPVVLEKDVIAAAQVHVWRRTLASHSFLFLYVGAGVALVPVLGGEVWRGPTGNAGEAGHLPAVSSGPRCTCGRNGCLGAMVGELAMVQRARELGLRLPGDEHAVDPATVDNALMTLLDLADDGEPRALEVLSSAAEAVDGATSSLGALLDVDTLVVGGPRWSPMRPYVAPRAEKLLSTAAIHGVARPIRLVTSPLEWRGAAVGAACLVLEEAFSPRVPKPAPRLRTTR